MELDSVKNVFVKNILTNLINYGSHKYKFEIVFLKSSEKCPHDNYFKFSATVMKTCICYLIKLDIKRLIMSKAVKTWPFSYFTYVIIEVSAV